MDLGEFLAHHWQLILYQVRNYIKSLGPFLKDVILKVAKIGGLQAAFVDRMPVTTAHPPSTFVSLFLFFVFFMISEGVPALLPA